jgi:hypothetical protein
MNENNPIDAVMNFMDAFGRGLEAIKETFSSLFAKLTRQHLKNGKTKGGASNGAILAIVGLVVATCPVWTTAVVYKSTKKTTAPHAAACEKKIEEKAKQGIKLTPDELMKMRADCIRISLKTAGLVEKPKIQNVGLPQITGKIR